MGDIQRRVVTLFDVQGASRVRAALGQMQSGFGGLRGQLDMTDRVGGKVDAQLRALGTTLRYTFAGTAIFGTLQMVRNLGDFQAKLGEIQSIASGANGLPLLDSQIDSLGSTLIDVSNRTTQPISDLEEGVLSLYSTIGDTPPNEAAGIMEEISKVAITSQSNIQDTTQALLGMIDAFGKGTDAIKTYGNEFYTVIQKSAGMTGAQYGQQVGRLASSAALGNFTPEQMGALAIGATRFGGSQTNNMNNLAQMMLYLMNPRSNKEKSTLAGIGLGPAQRQQLGGYGTLKKLLTEVNRRGGVGMSTAFQGATDDTLQQAMDAGLTPAQMGVSGGGSKLLSDAFGRIQSMRIAAILSKMMTPDQVAGTKNETLDQYLADVQDKTQKVDAAMERAMDYRRINQASNAVHNMGIEIGTALSPLLQYPARGITSGVSAFNSQHWMVPGTHVPGQTAEIAGGAAGIAVLLKMLRGSGRGAGLLRGVPIAAAGLDALSGDSQRGHSPLNPLYVAVVYSLGGGIGNRGNAFGIPTRDMRTAESELGGPGYVGGVGTKAARMSRLSKIGYGVGGAVFAAAGADMLYSAFQQHQANKRYLKTPESHSLTKWLMEPTPRIGIPFTHIGFGGGGYQNMPSHDEKQIINDLKKKKISADQAETMLRRIASTTQLQLAGATRVQGKADVNVTINDASGKKRGASHVTVDLFPDFTAPAPQTKAKPTTYRGGR